MSMSQINYLANQKFNQCHSVSTLHALTPGIPTAPNCSYMHLPKRLTFLVPLTQLNFILPQNS